jgi:hypothetical protein
MITLSTQSFPVFYPKTDCGNNAPKEEEKDEVSQDHSMSQEVSRAILGSVDVAAHDAIEVSPSTYFVSPTYTAHKPQGSSNIPNDESERDSTFENAFDVVAGP